MRAIPIEEITMDGSGWLTVRPAVPAAEDFEFIYRTATGIRWWPGLRALGLLPEEKSVPPEAFRRILDAVRREYGYELCLTCDTQSVNVPDELRVTLEGIARKHDPN
jgi:hypothetical protein